MELFRQQIRDDQAGVPGLRFRCGHDKSGDLSGRLSFPDIWRFRCKRIKVSGRGISELGHGAETNIELVKFAQFRLNDADTVVIGRVANMSNREGQDVSGPVSRRLLFRRDARARMRGDTLQE